jgi:hypothetical protein
MRFLCHVLPAPFLCLFLKRFLSFLPGQARTEPWRLASVSGGCAFHFADLCVLPRLTLEGVVLLLRHLQLAPEVVVEFHDPLAFPSSLLPRLILSGGTNGGNCPWKI